MSSGELARGRILGRLVMVLVTLATGALLALQARINAFLAADLGNGLGAGALVFAAGFASLAAFTALCPPARLSVRTTWTLIRRRQLPWYLFMGGPIGVLAVQAQIVAVPLIGVSLFAMAFIVGQMSAGTLIDHFGLSLGLRRRLNRIGVSALGLALLGVAVASLPRLETSGTHLWLPCSLVFVGGACVATQMALNGTITASVGRPEPPGLATYLLGSGAYLLVMVVWTAADGGASFASYAHVKWWYAALGIIGPAVVLTGAVLVRRVGVLFFALGVVTGQLTGSMLLDTLWPSAAGHASAATLLGAGMALVALVALQRWGQRTDAAGSADDAGWADDAE